MLTHPRPQTNVTLTAGMEDQPKDKCGVFGVWGAPDAAHLAYTATYAQQHRGQESAGICVSNGQMLSAHAGMGLVSEVFSEEILDRLVGSAAIGHNRYSTTGASRTANCQPLLREYVGGQIALGHNGNLINAELLRRMYEERGHMFQTTTDSEVILSLIASHYRDHHDPLVESLKHLQGAYSLVLLYVDRIEAARDPWGWRPLVLGELPGPGSRVFTCVASETVALDAIGARYVREVEPGEIVTLGPEGVTSRRFADPQPPAHCIFEHVYFANPSSKVFGETVQVVRERMGEKLAEEAPVDADCVIPMPDSGRSAALGYSRASGLDYREGIVPNRYVGRTFIQPTQKQRDYAVHLKHNAVAEIIEGNRIVVVDDSVVRGTTTRGKMKALRRAGAKEIHLRISCPPIRYACYFGVDFPDPSKLIAASRTVEEIREFLGVDTLHFLSLEGMLTCVNRPPNEYCTACWSGEYRINVEKPVNKLDLERYQLKMFTV